MSILAARLASYRLEYRQWREGGSSGSKGEVGSISNPPSPAKASKKDVVIDEKPRKARHHVAAVFDVETEVLEVILLTLLWCAALSTSRWDVAGSSMRLRDLLAMITAQAVTKRVYTKYLEWAYDAFPEKRTQKTKKRKDNLDSTGRTYDEVALVAWHDRFTLLSGLALSLGTYQLMGARLYPVDRITGPAAYAMQCLAQDLCLSFGMYWAHRNLHANKFLWRHVHALHHYAKSPVARTTQMDHWLDNLINAFIGETCTQLLFPLPLTVLLPLRCFRMAEGLEKHSGLTGWPNLIHLAQKWFPCAQQPHHHDWHHQGAKETNYAFAAVGGLWDVLFGTRHPGRVGDHSDCATPRDVMQLRSRIGKPGWSKKLDHPLVCPLPLLAFFAVAATKLAS